MNISYPSVLLVSIIFLLLLAACTGSKSEAPEAMPPLEHPALQSGRIHGPVYEIFVQSFYDANGDGIGDIRGLEQKLDYLIDLGVEAVWLMPIHPSPSYHRYDVQDYQKVDPDYGTLADFKKFVRAAHRRNIKVIIDLVLNHSSDQHHWFKEARKNKYNLYRNYYVWAKKDNIETELTKKSILHDDEKLSQWHKNLPDDEYYYGFFWRGMPDLNYENPQVRQEAFNIGRFWLEEAGIDGFRLDAAKYIFPESRMEETHRWWQSFRREMESIKPDVYLVGEVWDNAETVAPFFKGFHSAFNFDLSFALLDALKMHRPENLAEKLQSIRMLYQSHNPAYQDAIFITNHDQNRIMTELGGHNAKMKLAASVLLTLPGIPFIYYGEEIGMRGQKPDKYIREPFIWDLPSNQLGTTTWLKSRHNVNYRLIVPAHLQMRDSNSLYRHYQKCIALRKRTVALNSGEIDTTSIQVEGLINFVRTCQKQQVWVLHNFAPKTLRVDIPEAYQVYTKILLSTKPKTALYQNKVLFLSPYASLVLAKE